jgi:phosphoribosylformylglycinamidine cyclo-ligase
VSHGAVRRVTESCDVSVIFAIRRDRGVTRRDASWIIRTMPDTPRQISYKDAGVDIDAATAATKRITSLARATFTPNVLSEVGGFGALFRADFGALEDPVLVASADGVGTKLRVAFMTGVHDTVGYDLVCHCVNDILVQGARPLFFLDYFATGGLDPETVVRVVEGIARGCRENGCALIGGETAEMPGFYAAGEYDVAGFIVGVVDRKHAITGTDITPGDVVLGLPSVGLHTNGYSLARKLLFEVAGHAPDTHVDALGETVGAALLRPHRSYLRALEGLLDTGRVKGLAHITGGGLVDNPPRILPEKMAMEIELGSWPIPPLFELLVELGHLERDEAYRALNMGIGMIVVTSPGGGQEAVEQHLRSLGEPFHRIGRVVEGDRGVRLVE